MLHSFVVLRHRELLPLVSVLPSSRKEGKCNRDVFRQPAKLMLFACRKLLLLVDKLPCPAIIMLPMRLVRERRKREDITPIIIESALFMHDVMQTTCATSCSPESVLLRLKSVDKLLQEGTLRSPLKRELLPSEPKSRRKSSVERPRLSASDNWLSRSAKCKRLSASACSQPKKLQRSVKLWQQRRRPSKIVLESCRRKKP